MAGFPLGGGGHHHHHHSRGGRDDDDSRHPPVNPSEQQQPSSSSAAAFLYATTASARGGFQLWQGHGAPHHQHPYYGASTIIRFADDPAASGSSSRGAGRGSSGAGAGTISCLDCGNQAKKDCTHMRCRTCCKSRGFDCATHVKSTWVPAARRRERHHQQAAPGSAAEPSKRPREGGQPSTTTSSGGEHQQQQQQMMVAERFPREVSSEAVFRCVQLGPVDEANAEVAYQTTVSIAGHVFKGILHDVGPDTSLAGGAGGPRAAEGSSPSTAGGEGGSGATAVSSSAVVMDPYPTPGPFGAFGGAPFFHGHPR